MILPELCMDSNNIGDKHQSSDALMFGYIMLIVNRGNITMLR